MILQYNGMTREEVFYVVFVRRWPNIYISWLICQQQVVGYKDNVYKSYKLIDEAQKT